MTVDDKGFVRTGMNIDRQLETSLPGVFAIGDVRGLGHVVAAVGEGRKRRLRSTLSWRTRATVSAPRR